MLLSRSSPWTWRWLMAGAGVELAINAWAMGFVVRLGVCEQRSPAVLWRTLVALQTAMLVLLVAFAVAISVGAPTRVAGWISSAFFATGLATATVMRAWIQRVPPACRRGAAGVSDLEYRAVDTVNWLALLAIAIKLIGFAVSTAIALRG